MSHNVSHLSVNVIIHCINIVSSPAVLLAVISNTLNFVSIPFGNLLRFILTTLSFS